MKVRTGLVGRLRAWLRARELVVVLAGAGACAFLVVAVLVETGHTRRFDEWGVRALRSAHDPAALVGPAWVEEVARDLTALGGYALLVLFTLAGAGYLWLARKSRAGLVLTVTVLGALVLNQVLKNLYDRPRPALVPHLSDVRSPSFPSGHSMLSAVVYLTLAAQLAQVVPRRSHKVYFVLLALLFTGLVGLSRVALGVHWPTDVLAGWSAGLSWALFCWLVARRSERRGSSVESGDASE